MSSATLWKIVKLVVLGALVVSCASKGRNYVSSNMDETLEIEILPNDSKMFVYRLSVPENKVPGTVRIARAGGEGRDGEHGGVSIGRGTQDLVHQNAGFVVEKMGYCKEGFLEIDSSASRFNLWLKGECKDGATADDRKQFGIKQTLPVKLGN
jgi:hypothetical protein